MRNVFFLYNRIKKNLSSYTKTITSLSLSEHC